MKFRHTLNEILGRRSNVKLLRTLIQTPTERTGRELARDVGLDPRGVREALADLVEQGVVEVRPAGRALLYRANDRHVIIDLLTRLFQEEGTLLSRFAGELRKRSRLRPISIILFGSAARGTERPTSDVDLVFVTETGKLAVKEEERLDSAMVELSSRFGSTPQVMVIGLRDFQRRAKKGDGFINEILRTGRVIHGKPISGILTGGR